MIGTGQCLLLQGMKPDDTLINKGGTAEVTNFRPFYYKKGGSFFCTCIDFPLRVVQKFVSYDEAWLRVFEPLIGSGYDVYGALFCNESFIMFKEVKACPHV